MGKNYWVFGLCPLSSILKTREHNVSETGSVSEMLCSLVSGIPDNGQSQKNLVILKAWEGKGLALGNESAFGLKCCAFISYNEF
jgi:hypothetical protein